MLWTFCGPIGCRQSWTSPHTHLLSLSLIPYRTMTSVHRWLKNVPYYDHVGPVHDGDDGLHDDDDDEARRLEMDRYAAPELMAEEDGAVIAEAQVVRCPAACIGHVLLQPPQIVF